jgi:biotin carboxylase
VLAVQDQKIGPACPDKGGKFVGSGELACFEPGAADGDKRVVCAVHGKAHSDAPAIAQGARQGHHALHMPMAEFPAAIAADQGQMFTETESAGFHLTNFKERMAKKRLTREPGMTPGKTLLIISGGIATADAARRAKKMGLTVVMSDGDPQAPGFAFADSCLIADAYASPETAAAAERYSRKIRKIDGVIGIAVQAPLTVATVAQRLRLPGLPVHVAELIEDRLALKKCFVSAGIASPWFAEVRTPQELQRAVIAQGRDLVIAPVGGRGAMQRLAEVEDLAGAFLLARSQSVSERVMVEKSPDGPRLFTQSLVSNGRCFTPCLFDRDKDRTRPSLQPEDIQARVRDLVARAASAAGVSDGAVMAEIVLDHGEPALLTLGASLSGEAVHDAGMDLTAAAIRQALGENHETIEG